MSTAQDEYNELMRDKSHRTTHRDDSSDDDHSDAESHDLSPRDAILDEDEDFDDHNSLPRPSISSSRSTTTIPTTHFYANTGPKGVITDARDFVDSRRVHRRQSAMLLAAAAAAQMDNQRSNGERKFGEEEDEDTDDDEEDSDFMDRWRESRLRELQNGAREGIVRVLSPARSLNGGGRRFGSLANVDGDGYLDAVDNSGKDTVVIVYIYDDYSDVSTTLEECCVRPLATKYATTRFVKMHYEEAAMEPAGVPALLAYRNGEKFSALVPLIDEIPDDADLSAVTLEAILRRHQILH